MDDLSLPPLVRGVKLLCLDAGNTVIFLDHARLATWVTARGTHVSADTLVGTEGEAKLSQERGTMVDVDWEGRHLPGAIGWGKMVGTMLVRAGVSEASLRGWLPGLWAEHVRLNFWSVVPEGLVDALRAVRAAGGRVAIVSNSEVMLDGLFRQLGVRDQLDLVLDSGVVGVEKPDPRIFRLALDRFALSPDEALHLGDSIATDVEGARAAGVRVALVDPFGHCAGRALDVPRVPGATEVARALAGAL